MRSLKSFIQFLLVALLFVGCNSDLERVTYSAEDAMPATLEQLDESYELDVMMATQVAMTISWSEPDFGYSAAATNNVEIDLSGGDFTKSVTLASIGRGGEFSINHADLNNAIAKLFAAYDEELIAEPKEFDVRVRSSISSSAESIMSDVVTTTITPYDGEREYASIALRGDYNGWDFDNSQRLYSANDDEIYSGFIYFNGKAANGWKLCEDAGWSTNWGVSGSETAEHTPITLVSGGDNFLIYSANSYLFEFNRESLEFKVLKTFDSWGLVGSFNDWGGSEDSEMTLGNDGGQFFLETTLDLESGSEWKIRADNDWGMSFGCSDLSVEDDSYLTDGGNFTTPESGSYTIRWYFNNVKQSIEIVKN